MPEANGVPIRLVHENGSLTELMATEINLNVDRKISGHSFPGTGGALWGLEFNVPNTMIEIEGIFTDDKTNIGDTFAFSILDFSCCKRNTGEQFITTNNMTALLTGAKIELKDTTGTTHEVVFISSVNGGHTATYINASNSIAINTNTLMAMTPIAASEAFAIAVKQFIDGELSAYFSTSDPYQSEFRLERESVVKVTQKVIGGDGNNITPNWSSSSDEPYTFLPCYFTDFSGGYTGLPKSAGDKVQDMYGILNNSSRHHVDPATTTRTGTGPLFGHTFVGKRWAGVVGDYIVGIQIPYNSMVQASAGSDKYVPRNFYRRTGATTKITDKGSEANNVSASASFTTDGKTRTGMQGAVHKIDITYEAGEAVYGFVLLFAPIDAIL